ncbi:hypothetical protein QLS71_006220 [Mariniflexile litorale]|uniref:Uncharacterized protein n=1 Tax=Mariniflexile litorale TaxID=3045158 RepID=A0AAU7EHP2_9FLAO|nr:hypothetical protein [Mariniflexile sp. KMM 9835]MDQ8211172.1 hypothetical protein [Mariniflexile sp. KMM 9835]
MESRILKIVRHSIYYTQNDYISFEQSNFPSLDNFKFKPQMEILWEVEIKKYDPSDKVLILNIIDYNSHKIDEFKSQTKNNTGLKKIYFENLKWNLLEPQFTHYKKVSFKGIVDEDSYYEDNNFSTNQVEFEGVENVNKPNYKPQYSVNRKESIDFNTTVHFKDAKFLDGSVKFDAGIPELSKTVEFEILNNEIKKEFDYIKYYFPKVFKRKTFEVIGTIILEYNKTEFENISSPEITKIDSSIVEKVKQIEFNRIIKLTSEENSKQLLNLDELFDKLDINPINSLFNENEQELIGFFVKDKHIKNKRQLVYLSGLKQNDNNKIKFTLKPNFGFLFTIISDKKIHYCWELLNSHATYLWSISNNFNNSIEIVEENINLISKIGRQEFKNEVNKKNNILPDSARFNLIRHSSNKEGFIKWKENLNYLLNN